MSVNPKLAHRGPEEEDLTRDRSDFKDAAIIATKVAELRCMPRCQLAAPLVLTDYRSVGYDHLGSRRRPVNLAALEGATWADLWEAIRSVALIGELEVQYSSEMSASSAGSKLRGSPPS